MARKSINEIVPGRLYQRGQVLTWKRADKEMFLREHNIKAVVNFWAKLDPDLSDLGIDFYLYAPSTSADMTQPRTRLMAELMARWLELGQGAALILCEAGVTRSIFFTTLVVSILRDCALPEALAFVEERVGRVHLKAEMDDYLRGNVAPGPQLSL